MPRATRETLTVGAVVLVCWGVASRTPLLQTLPLDQRGVRVILVAAGLVAVLGHVAVWLLPKPRKRLATALLLVTGCFLYFLSSGRALTGGDNFPARELPSRLIEGRGLHYEELDPRQPLPYWLTTDGATVHSAFPLGTGLAALPFGVVATLVAPDLTKPERLPVFEKLTAVALASLAVGLFCLGLAQRFGTRAAVLPSLAMAMATPVVTCQSQGLWSATGATLAVVLLLRNALRRGHAARPEASAALATCGLVLCRPSDIGASATAFARARSWQARILLALALGIGIVSALVMNTWALGSPFGGYGHLNLSQVGFDFAHIPGGLAGLLVSPSRGLLPFIPWLIVSVPIFARHRGLPSALRVALLLAIAATLLVCAAYGKWWGGHSFGPRLLAALSPLLAFTLLPYGWRRVRRRSPRRVVACGLLLLVAAVIQFLGMHRAVCWAWNDMADPDRLPEILWDVRNSQLAATLIPGWRFEPAPYPPNSPPPPSGGSSQWQRLDLAAFANARYDGQLFPGQANTKWAGAFPRLRADVMNRSQALFHFLPAGRPNAVALCESGSLLRLAIDPPKRVRQIHIVATVHTTADVATGAGVALLRIQPKGGGRTTQHLLRYDERLTPYDPNARTRWPPSSRAYGGRPEQRDAIFRIAVPSLVYGHDVESLEFEPVAGGGGRACAAFLAVTVESW